MYFRSSVLFPVLTAVVSALPTSLLWPTCEIPVRKPYTATDSDLMATQIWPQWYQEVVTTRAQRAAKRLILQSFQAELHYNPRGLFCEFRVRDTRNVMPERSHNYENVREQQRIQGPFYMTCPPFMNLELAERYDKFEDTLPSRVACTCNPRDITPSILVSSGSTNCMQEVSKSDTTAQAFTTVADVLAQYQDVPSDFLSWYAKTIPGHTAGGSQSTPEYAYKVDTAKFHVRKGTLYRVCAHATSGRPNIRLHLGFASAA